MKDSKSLNPRIFTLARILILTNLVPYKDDGVLFRELQTLNFTDGVLHSNLRKLRELGYITEDKVLYDEKEMTQYKITELGLEDWERVKSWLCDFLNCMGSDKSE